MMKTQVPGPFRILPRRGTSPIDRGGTKIKFVRVVLELQKAQTPFTALASRGRRSHSGLDAFSPAKPRLSLIDLGNLRRHALQSNARFASRPFD